MKIEAGSCVVLKGTTQPTMRAVSVSTSTVSARFMADDGEWKHVHLPHDHFEVVPAPAPSPLPTKRKRKGFQ